MFCSLRAKRASSFQYGYRKCGTRARVLSPTLPHRNSMNEIRQRVRGRRQAGKREFVKKIKAINN